jgi:hypothetical protein
VVIGRLVERGFVGGVCKDDDEDGVLHRGSGMLEL